METELLFSYGTFRDKRIQKALLKRSLKGNTAVLKDWSLFASDMDGYLFIRPHLNGEVKGVLLEIEKSMIHTLDQWEEIPFYKREKVEIHTNDRKVMAWVYTRRNEKAEPFNDNKLSLNDPEIVLSEAKSFTRFKEISNLPLQDRIILIPCKSSGKFNWSLKTDDFTENLNKYSNKCNRYLLKNTSIISEIKEINDKLSSEQRIKTYISFNKTSKTAIVIIPIPLNHRNFKDFSEEISFIENNLKLSTDKWLKNQGLKQKDRIRQLVFLPEDVNELPYKPNDNENVIIYRNSFNKTYEERLTDYAPLIFEQEKNIYSELV